MEIEAIVLCEDVGLNVTISFDNDMSGGFFVKPATVQLPECVKHRLPRLFLGFPSVTNPVFPEMFWGVFPPPTFYEANCLGIADSSYNLTANHGFHQLPFWSCQHDAGG